MSTTRLLILGAVRIFQPTHGYHVRRELLSWRVETWASLKPGSVYNALRTLTRERFLEELGTEAAGGPSRTTYRLTDAGEQEFLALLRDALSSVRAADPARVLAGVSFMWVLSRAEVRGTLAQRALLLEQARDRVEQLLLRRPPDPTTPPHVAEILRLAAARHEAERRWALELVARLDAGEYAFDGTPYPPGWLPEGLTLDASQV